MDLNMARAGAGRAVSDTATAMFEVHGSFAEHVSLTETMEDGRPRRPAVRRPRGTPTLNLRIRVDRFRLWVVSSLSSYPTAATTSSPQLLAHFSIGCCFSPRAVRQTSCRLFVLFNPFLANRPFEFASALSSSPARRISYHIRHGQVAVLGGVRYRIAHAAQAAFVDEVDDQFISCTHSK